MSEALYERYKDALRRGHVAALRGRHDAALAAYVEAATIAPERALPHASIGVVSLRLGRPADALAAFDTRPRPVAGRRGRARRARRRARARWAGRPRQRRRSTGCRRVQESAGRDGRRARHGPAGARAGRVAVAPSARRDARRAACARAPATPPGGTRSPGRCGLLERAAVSSPTAAEPRSRSRRSARPPRRPARSTVPASPGRRSAAAAPARRPARAEPDPLAAHRRRPTRRIEAGDPAAGRAGSCGRPGLLERAGRPNAALDACYEALALAPGDPDLHLALADLYLDRGWQALAADKLVPARPPGRARRRRRHRASARGTSPDDPPGRRRPGCASLLALGAGPARAPMLHSTDDAAAPRVDPRTGQADVAARHRHHRPPHLLAVQPHPRAPGRSASSSASACCSWSTRPPSCFDLGLLTRILQNGAVVGIFALVVVFQPELRRALERIGRVGSFGWLLSPADRRTVEHVAREVVARGGRRSRPTATARSSCSSARPGSRRSPRPA